MNILLLVLDDNHKAKALKYIDRLYPNSKPTLLLKSELSSKSTLEKIADLRKEKYDLAIVFSGNLQYQTKVNLLKGVLLLARAKEKKIIDDKGGKIEVAGGEFLFIGIPALIVEFILSFVGILFSFVFLNSFLFFLKIKKKKPPYKKNGKCFAYIQTTFAFGDAEGGDASYRAELAEVITALGYDIYFLTSCATQFKKIKNPVYLIKPGKVFGSLYDIHKLIYNYRFIWQAIHLFSRHKPTALIQYHDPYDFSGAFLATLLKIPFFLDIHNVSQWRLSYWHRLRLTYFAGLTENICLARADVIFTVSEELKAFLKTKVDGENIVVKPNGVNGELFNPLNKGEEVRKKYDIKAEVVVGYAGSFASNHGIELLANAIETISKKDPKIHFLLVGEGERYPYIKEFIDRKKLGDRVSLAGNVPHNKVPLYLAACDILIAVYTHSDFDGSPMKVFEYMAMEKALVSTTQGQIPRIINNGEEGLLIKLEDAKSMENSLIEAIQLLADDKELRVKMGKKARKKALENYTWKNTAEKIIKAYQESTAQ